MRPPRESWSEPLDRVPRNVRAHARHQAPADDPGQVSRHAVRGRRAGSLTGDLAGRAALDRDLDARGIRRVHERDARGPEPDVVDRPRPEALLLRLLP